MFLRHLENCREFVAGDGSVLRELLHPEKTDLQIGYSLAHAKVEVGKETFPHKLKSAEVYYVTAGEGLMHINRESFEVVAGSAVYIPPDANQHIKNTGDCDLEFLSIVEPAWRKEDEEVLEEGEF